jgi:hypothetical protein
MGHMVTRPQSSRRVRVNAVLAKVSLSLHVYNGLTVLHANSVRRHELLIDNIKQAVAQTKAAAVWLAAILRSAARGRWVVPQETQGFAVALYQKRY